MKKITITLIIITTILLIINNTTATEFTCIQESVNVSTACGGQNTGNIGYQSILQLIDPLNATDTLWNTRTIVNTSVIASTNIYINYTIPQGATNNSKIRINVSTPGGTVFPDLEIIDESCLTYDNETLQLRIYLQDSGTDTVIAYCYDGSWQTLDSYTLAYALNEERMEWEIDYDEYVENKYLIITAIGYDGEELESVTIWENNTQTTSITNPLQNSLDNYINGNVTSTTITINITDENGIHKDYTGTTTINETNYHINITLQQNTINLDFEQEGTPTSTTGFIGDQEKVINLTGNNIFYNQTDLEEGYVQIRYNLIDGENYTQYYEYINEYQEINQTIELIQNADWYIYFQVYDQGNSPLEDVNIYGYIGKPTSTWTNLTLFGRRLTDKDGYTYFWGDQGNQARFDFVKEGFQTSTVLVTIGDDSFDKDNAYPVYLEDEIATAEIDARMYIRKTYDDINTEINGTVMALQEGTSRSTVKIQTSYRITQGLTRQDITNDCDFLMRCPFTLTPGTDFNDQTAENITLYTYIDDELWKTIIITWDGTTKIQIASSTNLTGYDDKYVNPTLWIFIILGAIGIGIVLKNESSGVATFKILALLAGFISLNFWWLSTIIITEQSFKLLRRVLMGE